ncbi:hypothetical protein [Paenibacillus polymyxa]|nr:hypothetical protein [Paenibacillus polymyxa]
MVPLYNITSKHCRIRSSVRQKLRSHEVESAEHIRHTPDVLNSETLREIS